MDKIKNTIVIIGLIGGLMSMGTVIGGFVSVVRYWDHFTYMVDVVNATDVRYYHEVIKPRVEELWKIENKELH